MPLRIFRSSVPPGVNTSFCLNGRNGHKRAHRSRRVGSRSVRTQWNPEHWVISSFRLKWVFQVRSERGRWPAIPCSRPDVSAPSVRERRRELYTLVRLKQTSQSSKQAALKWHGLPACGSGPGLRTHRGDAPAQAGSLFHFGRPPGSLPLRASATPRETSLLPQPRTRTAFVYFVPPKQPAPAQPRAYSDKNRMPSPVALHGLPPILTHS